MGYNIYNYLAFSLEPIHIGTGAERLGRVDLTVAREPYTRAPKIPGTSLSGAVKFFCDLKLRDLGKTDLCASTMGNKKHDWKKCPVCTAFGFTPKPDKSESSPTPSQKGILQFTDACLIAYPVPTIVGPVWITTKPRLQEIGFGDGQDLTTDVCMLDADTEISLPVNLEILNLGWVALNYNKSTAQIVNNDDVFSGLNSSIKKRLAILPEWIFSHIVNDNMEIRTSVVIEPTTGAASNQGLFTYEAVSRGSLFKFQIIEHDYNKLWNKEIIFPEALGNDAKQSSVKMIEETAFAGIEAVGMGGLTSRGFGRLKIKNMGN